MNPLFFLQGQENPTQRVTQSATAFTAQPMVDKTGLWFLVRVPVLLQQPHLPLALHPILHFGLMVISM